MRLRKISIKNFRNLRNIEIYPSHTTIFVGENNIGKSNLLYALRLLLDPAAKRLELELSEEDINDVARSEGGNSFSIAIAVGDLQNHPELEAIFMERLDREGDETYVTIEGAYKPDEEGAYNWKVQVLPAEGRNNDPQQFSPRMARSIPLYYLDAVRDAKTEMRATGRSALSQLLSGLELEDEEGEVIEGIRSANEAISRNQGIYDLATGIRDLLSANIPGGQAEASMSVATEDPTQLVKNLRLNLKCHSDSRAYDMDRHGTGLQNLVLIAMFRHRISTGGYIQPILAIEEPEAHLHPQAQRCLFSDLNSIDSPVLLTTHSSAIVECSDPLGIVRLTRNQHNEVTAHQLNPTKIDDEDIKLLARMMRSGRADAFFARAIIVVEGLSEVVALPAFAEQISYNLNREGVSVVLADGNSFSYILHACCEDHFSIPAVVTFDTDVLDTNNNLVNEAYKAGLLSERDRDACRHRSAADRQQKLEEIGWIPAIHNFEEEVAKFGYLPVIFRVIDDNNFTDSLDRFTTSRDLQKDAQGVSKYIKESRDGKSLKIPIARAVANEVVSVRRVPDCYKDAIEKAVSLAIGS